MVPLELRSFSLQELFFRDKTSGYEESESGVPFKKYREDRCRTCSLENKIPPQVP